MTILPLIVAASLSQTAAAADDGVGIRLKVNSDLLQIQSAQGVDADGDIEGASGKATTFGLFQGTPRLEATYVINPNIEAGLILGYANAKTVDSDNDFGGQSVTRRIGATFAYNAKISDGLRFYAQPLVISGKADNKDEDGESTGYISSLTYGANLGLRVRLVKGATFDPGVEFLTGSGKSFDKDGDQSPDEDTMMKYTSYGLKAGISVKF